MSWFEKNSKSLSLLPTSEIPKIGEAVERFMAFTYQDMKASTKKQSERYLRYLLPYLTMPLKDISSSIFEAILPALRGASAPKEWANRLSVYKRFFKFCVDRDWILKSPCAHIKPPPKISFGGRSDLDLWTEERFEKVKAILPEQFKDALDVLYFTGIDVGDLYTLLVREVLVKDGNFIIQKIRGKAKSRRELIQCPISSKIKSIFEGALIGKGPADRVLPFKNVSRKQFQDKFLKRLKLAQVAAGYKDTKDVKSLRHTFATRHASRGVPMWQLKKFMGHTPESTILESLYVHDQVDVSIID